MAASAEAREHTRQIRECVLAILRDTWPQPWATPDLQDAFAPRECQRVYNALTRLWSAGEVEKFTEQRWNWWVAIGDPLSLPRCDYCGREVTPDGHGRLLYWYGHGGWWCGNRTHFADLINREWPWPRGDEMSQTLVVVR